MRRLIECTFVAIAAASSAAADSVALVAIKDNTLIETVDGALSNGSGPAFFAGRVGGAGGGSIRRGVLQFDLSGAVPVGSTVTSATLTLSAGSSSAGTQTVALRRLLASWGEGASFASGGSGAPSQPGDATWIHRIFPDVFWSTPGGDFSTEASASAEVGGVGVYSWGGTGAMVADVQDWLDDPDANFGWLVQGNESAPQTVKRFDSREVDEIARRPMLVIEFVPPSPCVLGDLDCNGVVDGADLGALLGAWGTPDVDADLDGDGIVDGVDVGLLLAAWSA
ncbi:MAG: DNRLRE domain-containing protein [Phycisphaerales bacterium]